MIVHEKDREKKERGSARNCNLYDEYILRIQRSQVDSRRPAKAITNVFVCIHTYVVIVKS